MQEQVIIRLSRRAMAPHVRVLRQQLRKAIVKRTARTIENEILYGTRQSAEKDHAEQLADEAMQHDIARARLIAQYPSSWWKHLNQIDLPVS